LSSCETVKNHPPKARKIRLFIWIAAIAAGLALTGVQIAKKTDESSARMLAAEQETQTAKPVEVMRIAPSGWETWKSCYGQARSAKSMNVTSFVREVVEAVHVSVGDKVQKGQLLLTLRRQDQEADEQAAEAAYAEAKTAYDRLRALSENGRVARSDADKAYAVMKSEEAKYQNHRSALSQTQARSKISGIVTARHVEPGEIAEIGQILLRVEDPSDIEAEFMVSVKDISRISAGTHINVIVHGTAFKGKVKSVNPAAQDGTGFCAVIASVGSGVLPGTYLEGSFLARREEGAIVIPSSSVIDRGGERFAYTASESEDGLKTARLAKIKTGDGGGGKVVVMSGLTSGDLLITSGSRGLSDGAPVLFGLTQGETD
jgi:RND family efflux transporter MFP subunit